MDQDAERLKLLTIFYYVVAGMFALLALLGVFPLAFGIAILSGALPMKPNRPGEPDPREFAGGLLLGEGTLIFAFAAAFAVLLAVTGWLMARRRGYVFSLVVAGVACTSFPTGTLLGVFTFLLLLRPTVKAMYYGGPVGEPPVLIPAAPAEPPVLTPAAPPGPPAEAVTAAPPPPAGPGGELSR
jgi:hypothetical protein